MELEIGSLIDRIINTLKSADLGVETDIVNAYVNAFKPTDLQRPVAAVGFDSAQLAPAHIGDSTQEGEIAISLNIYAPYRFESRGLGQLFEEAVSALADFGITGISSEGICADKQLGCCVCRCTLLFDAECGAGGEQGD
jgi:hypothetical protein